MTDAERLQATRIFIAALSQVTPEFTEPIPFDPRTFAEVVASLQATGNAFAKRFIVFETVAGKNCPDFQHGMTAAQSAGLIARQNPTYQYFSVRMAHRTIDDVLKAEAQVSTDASMVARQYCLALGTLQA
ncbi:MAG TPA: hypothetical protein VGM88_12480 [Kofleriaceae bacterium]|jgi:hypothetical protein